MKKYEIHWRDHFSESGWKGKDEIKKWVKENAKDYCSTVGFIAYENKTILVMASSYNGVSEYGDFQAIYKNHIVKRRRVR